MNSIIKYSLKYIKKYKWSFFFGILLVILAQAANNVANLMVKFIFEEIEIGDYERVLFFVLMFGALRLIPTILGPLANQIHDIYLISGSRDMKVDIFKKIHELDVYFHSNKRSGSLISMMRRGENAYWSWNIEIERNLMRIIVDLIFTSVTFFVIQPILMVVILGGFLLNLAFTFVLIRINVKARRELNDQEDHLSGIIADNMINFDTVKYFGNERYEQKRLGRQYQFWTKAIWKYANSFRIIEVWIGLLITVSVALLMYFSVNSIEAGAMTAAEFVVIITFSLSFFPRLGEVIFRLRELTKNQADFEKYLSVLNEEIQIKEIPGAKKLQDVKGEIEYKDVTFSYNAREPVVKNLNLKIKPNESVAFVGVSGAGKSTLVKLLLRFYDVTNGQILIDGKNIKDLNKESLRKSIGIVPQDAMMFNDTVRFNIGYAKEGASLKEVKEAAKLAYLHEFIETLPEKYDTLVGERGIKLSGGQRQRLAIARTILEDPPIVVFDEATSQLDSESEKAIQEAFWNIAKNKTTIIIAHRLSTIRKADRIIVLKDGEIVEEGTHQQLSKKKGGVYNNLWNLQTGELIAGSN